MKKLTISVEREKGIPSFTLKISSDSSCELFSLPKEHLKETLNSLIDENIDELKHILNEKL